MDERKLIERRYYDGKAAREATVDDGLLRTGAEFMAPLLRAPYLEFERRVRESTRPGDIVLDIGAGTGIHSLAADGGQRVIGVDLSLSALLVAKRRGSRVQRPLNLVCGDAERLPIADGSVDVVTTAGLLYCVDLATFVREIQRVLRPTGTWILVDSFDHNPIYRLNRLVGFLRGRRTKRALTNIPNRGTVARLKREFRVVDVSYHGVFAFLGPLFRLLLGEERAVRLLDQLDRVLPAFHDHAFKIVATLSEPVGAAALSSAPATLRR